MKTILLFLILTFDANLSYAQGGGSVGNGGKGTPAYLTDAIVALDRVLAEECSKLASPSILEKRICAVEPTLFQLIITTKIDVQYIVYGKLDHKPRDAVNDTLASGEHFVTFSLKRLLALKPDLRRRVLLHEFMTLGGYETSDSYGYSSLILRFLEKNPELEKILTEIPVSAHPEKTFRGTEATVSDGQKHYAVLLQNVEDYTRFCIANGFDQYSSFNLVDVTYKEWKAQTQLNLGVATLNDEGSIVTVASRPAAQTRVILSVTCK